jgi:hypothetical protein
VHHPHLGARDDNRLTGDLALPEAEALYDSGLWGTKGFDERADLGIDGALHRNRRQGPLGASDGKKTQASKKEAALAAVSLRL